MLYVPPTLPPRVALDFDVDWICFSVVCVYVCEDVYMVYRLLEDDAEVGRGETDVRAKCER